MLKLPAHITLVTLFGAMFVAACQFPTPSSPPSTIPIAAVPSDAYAKSLYVAEAGFAGVTSALETALDADMLKGANAVKALEIYDKLKGQLNKARTTKQQADAIVAQAYIADLWAVLLATRH